MIFAEQEALSFLRAAHLLFDNEYGYDKPTLNMNDVWGWATGDCEEIDQSDLPEVARLFWSYGWPGILYWVSEKRNQCKSEFPLYNRYIEFVRIEEQAAAGKSSSEAAYNEIRYSL